MLPYGAAMYNGLVLVVPDKYYQALPAELTDTLYGWHLNKNSNWVVNITIPKHLMI
jgi:hypothetical protein